MQIEIAHPQFQAQRLAVETAGWLRGPKLFLNGAPVERRKGLYTVRADSGEDVAVKLKYNLVDPIPKAEIAGSPIEIVPALRAYEYVWIGLPLVLIAIGGALGGFLGALGAVANGRVFRGDRGTAAKYVLAALITLATVAAFVGFSTMFHVLVGK